MNATVTEVVLPDGRTVVAGQWFRIVGERGVYRAHEPSGCGLWAYGGDRHPLGRRQWRCVALDRVGTFVRAEKGCRS